MWKLTDWGKTRAGLPGMPWRDLTDAEFNRAKALYPELPERGYFAYEAEGPLGEHTVDELREHADSHDVDLKGARKKADIIERIEDATETPGEE